VQIGQCFDRRHSGGARHHPRDGVMVARDQQLFLAPLK